ncbi:hypothetical protein M8C21_019964 [Ambrosia artemisiifolia]|uniref:Uncharacterized protein n=1 Tax=Ambrosia artemisiifolia TaxID=4212 RepID=A0AAD5GAI3_AMBAR|nr:hypothetical protein M8C21_019964 [Ambrosia artemisiifolia]
MKDKKSSKLNLQHKQHQNGHLSSSTFSKLLDPEASWDKDQLGDVLHWIRQIVALVCGLLWGAIPLVGGIWLVTWLGLLFTAWHTSNCFHNLTGHGNGRLTGPIVKFN